MSTNSLAKVSIEKVERALVAYASLGCKAENELYAKIQDDIKSSGMTHVGILWWKKELTDELYLEHISDSGLGAERGRTKILNKYKGDMEFAPKYYMDCLGRLTNRYFGTERAIRSLIKARSSEYLYLDVKHCTWLNDMLAIEDDV